MDKILVVHAEGLGNQIQIAPCLRNLKEMLGYSVDYWSVFGSYYIPKNLFPYVDRFFMGNEVRYANFSEYVGIVATVWVKEHIKILLNCGLSLLNVITPLTMQRSEVDVYMQIVRDLGLNESSIKWSAVCNYNVMNGGFDVVMSNGYNKYGSANWEIKSYPYYVEVARLLKNAGYSVASVGSADEYIDGTVNRTGFDLLDVGGIIKNSRVVVSNDSAMYHYANALEVPNVVIFTATSIEKNYDKRFHKYSTIIGRSDLKCRPCQSERRWNKDCKTWDCRLLAPEIVFNSILRELEVK